MGGESGVADPLPKKQGERVWSPFLPTGGLSPCEYYGTAVLGNLAKKKFNVNFSACV